MEKYEATAHDGDGLVTMRACNSCWFGWQHPVRRSAAESADYFADAYKDAGTSNSDYFDPAEKEGVAKLQLQFVNEAFPKKGRLLDVGAGACTFARCAAADGWEVTAVDPALDPEEHQATDTSLTVFRGDISSLPKGEVFDVITLWDVIEHCERPVALLRDAASRLAANGSLVIETGNYMAADRVASGDAHWIHQLDHRWYFSPRTLEDTLGVADLRVTKWGESALRPTWKGKTSYSGPTLKSLVGSLVREPHRITQSIRRHQQLKSLSRVPRSGLPIFALTAAPADASSA